MKINLLRQCLINLLTESESFLEVCIKYTQKIKKNIDIVTFVPSPGIVHKYLKNKNWVRSFSSKNWHTYENENGLLIEVPQLQEAEDYSKVVNFLLLDLVKVEKRYCIEILFDLYDLFLKEKL